MYAVIVKQMTWILFFPILKRKTLFRNCNKIAGFSEEALKKLCTKPLEFPLKNKNFKSKLSPCYYKVQVWECSLRFLGSEKCTWNQVLWKGIINTVLFKKGNTMTWKKSEYSKILVNLGVISVTHQGGVKWKS